MRLVKLELKNYGRHKDKTVHFTNGLNAIVGPNGSGKTTILNAAYSAITGDWSRNDGKKEEDIYQLSDPSEDSRITLFLEHAGVSAEITRWLRPTRHDVLTVNGEDVRGAKNVTPRLCEILSTTPWILDKYAFVRQGYIFNQLIAPPAERAKSLQKLFGTEQAEKCWVALGQWLTQNGSHTVVETGPLVEERNNQRTKLFEVNNQITELATQLSVLSFDPANQQPGTSEQARVISEFDKLKELHTSRDRAVLAKEQQLKSLEEHAKLREEIVQDADAVSKACEVLRPRAEAAKTVRAEWDAYNRQEQSRHRVLTLRDAAQRKLTDTEEPEKPADYLEVDARPEVQNTLLEDQTQLSVYRKLIQVFDVEGQATCPTCGTQDQPAVRDAVENAKQQVQATADKVQRMQQTLAASAKYDKDRAEWKVTVDNCNDTLASLQHNLEDLQLPKPDTSAEKAAEDLSNYDSLVRDLGEVEDELRDASTAVATAEGRIAELDQTIEQATAAIAKVVVTPEQHRQAVAELQTITELSQQYWQVHGAKKQLADSVRQLEERIVAAEEHARVAEKRAKFSERMTTVREILHRDNLPRLVSGSYLQMLTQEVNSVLSVFEADFRVEVAEGLTFTAHFHDGRIQPATRLSGGQLVILAWGFQIAVNAAFASELGLICLDEPTQFLDSHNVERVGGALARLQQLSQSRGLQVIMVTHEESLGHLFDNLEYLNA